MNWLTRGLSRTFAVIAGLVLLVGLSGCGSEGSSANPPGDLAVSAGDGRVTLTWTMEPGVEYWVYYAPADTITVDTWASIPDSQALMKVSSPLAISGLTNGTTYAFTMDARVDEGPRGDGTPSISAVPRLAGSAWTAGTGLGTVDLYGVTYGVVDSTDRFVAVGASGTIATSTDAATWTVLSPAITTKDLRAVAYGGSHYVAAGADGTLLHSTDTATWTLQTSPTTVDMRALASNGSSYFVGVGANGVIIYSSNNGEEWSLADSGITTDLTGVGYGGGRFVAVGKGGVLLTSSDGKTWTGQSSGTTADLSSVAYGVDASASDTTLRYVVVGANGTVITSTDATTWTGSTSLGTDDLNAVTYATEFVAVGQGGKVYTSTTGTTWTAQTAGTSADLNGLWHTSYSYVAVGASGTSLLSK